jgi:hypothetical protein
MGLLNSRLALAAFQAELEERLRAKGADDTIVSDVLASGYYMRTFGDPFSGRTWVSVSDGLYGNKQLSSSFEPDAFVDYAVRRVNAFPPLPSFRTIMVKTKEDIAAVLSEPRRKHYLNEVSLSFRGQPQQYKLKRRLPNPVRSDERGEELSILPGAYRQTALPYTFDVNVTEQRIAEWLPPALLSEGADVYSSNDPMRVEQHYATQTRGLDVSFSVEVALFFATHRFRLRADGKALYDRVAQGEHTGAIYAFRFRDPPVKSTAFLIRHFDLFRNHVPERVLRQECGLPLMGDEERNIAITDIDCVMQLHPDFPHEGGLTPEDLFPAAADDRFYAELLRHKDRHPDKLASVVEYAWAR